MRIKVNLDVKSIFIVISVLISSWSCRNVATPNSKLDIGYDLENPDRVQALPVILKEISGITMVDSNTIACIQDENGILIFYDILQNKIISQPVFYENGDYEGICKVDTSIFILRSDGALFEISNYQSNALKVNAFATEMAGSNNEGLCYDQKHKRLLIARKNKMAKGKEFKNKRVIYSFDLASKTLNLQPVFKFDVDTIRKIISGKKIHFAISEIAIHPVTHKLFVLSSMDHLLFIINENGTVENIVQLNPKIFIQPEGMTFRENGDMFITNEGRNKNSTLLEFKYH
jgi:uncharacterized protein YjiK